jgi:hypothetical protein
MVPDFVSSINASYPLHEGARRREPGVAAD